MRISPQNQAILSVIGGCMVHFTLGTVYTFGNMNPYIVSYLKREHPSASYSNSVWIYAMAVFGQSMCMWLGGLVEGYLGSRLTVLFGGWLMSLGVLTTFFSIKANMVATVITYGLLFGCGIGLAYSVALAAATSWYPRNRGLVTGLVVAGYGGGAFVFNFVQTAFINPGDIKPDKEVQYEMFFTQEEILKRVPYSFLLIGGIYAAMQLVGALLITSAPLDHMEEGYQQMNIVPRDGDDFAAEFTLSEGSVFDSPSKSSPPKSPREMVVTRDFWILWSTFLFNSVCVAVISTMYKVFGQTFVTNDHFLATVGSVAAVCNSLGRVAWGQLHDRFHYKMLMFFQTALMAAFLISFQLTAAMGQWFYLLWVCVLFAIFSGNFALFPAVTSATFGQRHFAINYGIVFSANAVASLGGAFLLNMLKVQLGWFGTFALGAACAAFGFVCTFFFKGVEPQPLPVTAPKQQRE